MHRPIKLLLLALAGIVLAISIGMAVFIATFDANQYKETLITLVKQQTGRDFFIEGDLYLAPSLIPTMAVEGVGLGNADWGTQPLMLSISRMEAQIALLPLLRGDIFISRLILNEPVIHLQLGPDGRGNWQFREAVMDTEAIDAVTRQYELPGLDINDVLVEQAVITYQTPDREAIQQFNIERLSVHADGTGQPLHINLRAAYEDHRVHAEGTLGSLQALRSDQSFPINVTATVGHVRARLDGTIEQPSRLAGITLDIHAEADSLAELGKLAGRPLPALKPASLAGQLMVEPDSYRVQNLDIHMGDSVVRGSSTLRMIDGHPQLEAELQAQRLDLLPFQPDKSQQKSSRVFSTEKFDLSGLRAIDVNIGIQADTVLTRTAALEKLSAKIALHQGKLSVTPLSAGVAGGQMNGDITLDASGNIPALNARLELKNILPAELPAIQEKNLIREGRTHISFNGHGRGDSPAAIAGNLTGRLLVETGRGQLLSRTADLAGGDLLFSAFQMLNPLAEREATSQLVCGVLNFHIKEGIATADKGIALQTDKVNVLGSGVIDLRTEALDIRVRPRAREGVGIGLGTLSDSVYIRGTLANPTPAADAAGIARTAATVGGAVATGGLSLIARGLFDRAVASDTPCAVALGHAEAQTTREKPAADEKDSSVLEKATDEVRGMFRGLFGR